MGRQTDNCYTYESTKVALHMTECKKITGVHVPYVNNNEPGHGGSLADTAGAILKSALWRWTRALQTAIKTAFDAVLAAEAEKVRSHIALLAWHDPKEEWESTTTIKQISVVNSLHKEYPDVNDDSPFAGGIIFYLYYNIGQGIGFTRQQVLGPYPYPNAYPNQCHNLNPWYISAHSISLPYSPMPYP